MNAEQMRQRLERAARVLEGVPGVRVSVVLGGEHGDTVRAVAAAWGVEVDAFTGPQIPGRQIIAADRLVGSVSLGVQSAEPIPTPECEVCGERPADGERRCQSCLDAGECQRCGLPMVEMGCGIRPSREDGLCGSCVDKADTEARAAKAREQDRREAQREDAAQMRREALAEDAR